MSGSESPRIEGQTIGQVLRETAVRSPDNDAFVFMESGERTTWNEFDRQTDRLAKSLLALGLRPGDHFGVWATNVSQWVRLQFATARIGVVLVTINPSYRPAELEYALRQADVRGLALIDAYRSMNYFDSLLEVCPELRDCRPGQLHSDRLPELRWVIALRGRPGPGMVAWEDLPGRSDEVTDEELVTIENGLAPEDRINIQYTSGTTGSPKGATLSHRNLLLNAWYAAECQRFTAADRICIPVPLYHCFGCVMGTLCSATHGSAMVFPSESFDAGATLRAIEEQRCTVIYGVPTMFIAQLEHADYPQRDLSSLRTGIMAGSPCPIELMKRVTEEFGAREITIGYGQTELSPLLTQTHPDDPLELRVGTVGRPIPGVEVKVVDPETGDDLGDGQQGEICGRGHCVMIGYYNQPAKTAEAIDADGWLHTGDLGVREPNGYFRVTGRLRDMIIRGGENVYPREIEERLYQHSAVEDVQVVGVPDRRLGEQVLACVKLRDRQSATETELQNFCAESLAIHPVPDVLASGRILHA